MTAHPQLKSANELAKKNGVRFPNESGEYRHARDALLAEEIELRRHIERVADQRRALPAGGKVPKNYALIGENGPANFSELFGDKQTLAVYSYMYGPKRAQPCPMCSSLMAAWDGEALDVEQRIALVMVARSPIERLLAVKKERGWRNLRLYSDVDGDFTRDYVSAEDADMPGFNVFTRRDGSIRHFWSGNGMVRLGSVMNEATEFGLLVKQPDEVGGTSTQSAYLVVIDADAVYASAKAGGARIAMEIRDEDYGGLSFSCCDLKGHLWSFGTYDPW